MQVAVPFESAYVPALHCVHEVLPAKLNVPIGHAWQVLIPVALTTLETVPAMQLVHDDVLSFLYVPTGQYRAQCDTRLDPTGEMVFAGQLVHDPPPHVLLYVLTGQEAHVWVPTTVLYLPAPQQYQHRLSFWVYPELQVPAHEIVPLPLPP